MIEWIGLTLGLAAIDSLNPATIGTMVILLPLVKKVEHALIFLFSTYITYLAGGLSLYFGIDGLLGGLVSTAVNQYAQVIGAAEILLGAVLLVWGLQLWFKKRSKHEPEMPQAISFKSLRPGYIFLFGVGSTLSDIPTGLPLIGFVGKMINSQPSPIELILLLSIYVLIYVSPLILLYVVYQRMQEKTYRLGVWFNQSILIFNRYALPPLVFACGAWLLADGMIAFLGQ